MILHDFDKLIKFKFLLCAGSAGDNAALSAAFNQHRSTLLDLFIERFNTDTLHYPGDIFFPTIVYLPLKGSKIDSFFYTISMPTLRFFFSKFLKFCVFRFDNLLMFVELSLLLLLKFLIFNCFQLKYTFINIYKLVVLFKTFYHSLKSYTQVLNRKVFIFSIFWLNFLFKKCFYKFEISKSFGLYF